MKQISKSVLNFLLLLVLLGLSTCDRFKSSDSKKKGENKEKIPPKKGNDVIPVLTNIVQLSTDKSVVEAGSFANLSMKIEIVENKKYNIFWESTCGMVSPDISGFKAIFISPKTPSTCYITAYIKDLEMNELSKRKIAIEVESALEPEVDNEL
jgi:hypothetical protein